MFGFFMPKICDLRSFWSESMSCARNPFSCCLALSFSV